MIISMKEYHEEELSLSIEHWPSGIKRTKQREIIWHILETTTHPLTAAEIATQATSEERPFWMSTIYRTLDFFLEKNLVTKTTIANNDMALYELTPLKHRHYAICTVCHKIISIENCPIQEQMLELTHKDFTITGHNLEVYGICHNCQTHTDSDKIKATP
jgi:Fur family ferric uptake transcriptional regulator